MTKIKSAVVSRKVCAQISLNIGLVQLLNLGKGMSSRPGLPASVTAAVLESIIAAMYLDGGIEPVREFILKHMVPFIDEAADSAHQQNFKSVLQHYAQKHLPAHPSYVMLDEKGPDHSKCFEVCVEIDGRRFSSAWANSKKEAEQKAALLALTELGVAKVDDSGRVTIAGQIAVLPPVTPPPPESSGAETTEAEDDANTPSSATPERGEVP
jgi:ribonuclease-3